MSYHFTKYSARRLYEQQLRRAWLCFWISWLPLIAGGWLLSTHRALHATGEIRGMVGFIVKPEPPASPTTAALIPPGAPAPQYTPLIPQPELPPLPLAEATPVENTSPAPPLAAYTLLPTELSPEPAPTPARRLPPAAQSRATSAAKAPAVAQTAPTEPGNYTPPAYRSAPTPPYPASMRQSRLEGSVRLRIYLNEAGTPQRVDIIAGSGHAAFDTTARDWVLHHWSFTPARRDGRAIPGTVVTSVRFVLN